MRKPNSTGLPPAQGLYLPEFEHDSCGVGFVAHIKGKRSHKIIEDADHLLRRVATPLDDDVVLADGLREHPREPALDRLAVENHTFPCDLKGGHQQEHRIVFSGTSFLTCPF